MTLVLALDASSRAYAIAVGSGDQPAAVRSSRRDDPEFAGLGELTARTLTHIGASFSDITAIGLDVGPGGLSSIRAAVAYANGLAFSLGVPIFAISSLELMAIAAEQGHREPVLSWKRGQVGNVYAALFVSGKDADMRHGLPGEVLPTIAGGLDKVRLAGATGDDVADLLPGVTVVETGVADADVAVLYQATMNAIAHPERLVSVATPLNEASRIFHEPSSSRSPDR